MKTSKQFLLGLLAVGFMAGCSDDDPVPGGGDDVELGATLTAEMGSDLSKQVYVDLSEGEMTTVTANSWELAFYNSGNAIRTNSAKKVAVAVPTESNFADVSSDEGLTYKYDSEDGDLSTTAFAGWQSNTPYIVDLGVDANGNALGKKKFMVTDLSTGSISVQFADLDGSNETTSTISRGSGNFTFFSLINDQAVTVEPASWDFVITAVTVRTGAPCAALGPGAQPGINCDVYRLTASTLTNLYDGVEVAKDDPFSELEQNDDPASEKNQKDIDDSNYETLGLQDFTTIGGSDAGDAIGRSWLQILQPHSAGQFKVYDFITYIVKDQSGNYYKVRFLAYKGGPNAENGNPTFEYELISE